MQLAQTFSASGRSSSCSFCGSGPGKENSLDSKSNDRPIVTTDLDIEMEGTFEFCLNCAAEAGALAGMLSASQTIELTEQWLVVTAEVDRLSAELDASRSALRSLSSEFNTQQALLEPPADDLA